MKFIHVVGARPNFMKVAPVYDALAKRRGVQQILVHSGQHYDANMSDIFFKQLGIPEPDINLQVGSSSHATQTAETMMRLEPVLQEHRPDWLIVYGDINSTIAGALTASKLHIKVAHVEAGLRSGDRTMPEEINRILTDRIADLLFTPSVDGDANLIAEGVAKERIKFVGNVMIDTLARLLPRAKAPDDARIRDRYVLVTIHRPANVDHPDALKRLLDALTELSREVQIVFPIHPRTRKRIGDYGIKLDVGDPERPNLLLLDPQGYLEFVGLQKDALAVLTDSGGIQEETTYLETPCLTLRENTERPVTVTAGSNEIIGCDASRLVPEVRKILAGDVKRGTVPELWDGRAGERIADVLVGS